MKIDSQIFRMYDIRGIADETVTEELAYHVGRAYGTLLREKGGNRVGVGRDVRVHSQKFKEALIEGLRDNGVHVVDLGVVPTPVVYFSEYQIKDLHGTIQVTASHNPREYNGFKITMGKETVFGEGIQKLRQLIESENYTKTFEKGKLEEADASGIYIDWISKNLSPEPIFKVAIDTGNGVAGPIMKELFEIFKFEFKGLYIEPDGNFPNHLPDPTVVKYMKDLMELVKNESFDIGIGIDGDGDRIGVVTDKGELIFGDKILAIFATEVIKSHPGATIIFDVKCSKGLIEYLERLGAKPYMYKTGHSLLKAKLRELNAPLAGEMSGHIFFNDRYFGFDDAIYGTFRLLEFLSREKKKISEIIELIPRYESTPEIRVGCPDNRKFDVVKKIVDSFKKQGYRVIDIDGARVEFESGFGLIRASNTQPVLVIRCEGKTKEEKEKICEILKNELSRYPEVELRDFIF